MDASIEPLYNKIDELNKQACEIRGSDSNKLNTLSRDAPERIRSRDYTKGKAEGLRTLAFTYALLRRTFVSGCTTHHKQ